MTAQIRQVIVRDHPPATLPERQKRTTWQEFLKARWDVLAATDFFSVEVSDPSLMKVERVNGLRDSNALAVVVE